jgi:osmotically-inducible protein OsmY
MKMKLNDDLQKDVQDAIRWEPLLNTAEIGVTAKDGVITLTGIVDSYTKKVEAEKVAKDILGVKAIVQKIEIQHSPDHAINDNDIAANVLGALKLMWNSSKDNIQVKVENGWVTLEGALQWNYQKESATNSIAHLDGVKGVSNNIRIQTEVHDEIQKKDIEKAIARNWAINGLDIQVKVVGTKVILNGLVQSLYQKEEAARITWNAPGVWSVDNELVVEYHN